MTAFTDEEERIFGTAEAAPWLLASRMDEQGAQLENGEQYQPFTVIDGHSSPARTRRRVSGLAESVPRLLQAQLGSQPTGNSWELSLEEWHRVLDVNLWGVIRGVRASSPGSSPRAKKAMSSTPARWPR